MKPHAIEGQMALDLFPHRIPGACADETRTVDIGGVKSFCAPWDCWTNCREVGHCVYETRKER